MAVKILNSKPANVVKIGGVCYEYKKTTTATPTVTTWGSTFSNCTDCSSCSNNDPEMYLTVLDADYAGGDINWCGETWTQSEVQAGVEKGPVCPASYTLSKGAGTTNGIPLYNARHSWKNVDDGGLLLFRNYQVFQTFGKWYRYAILSLTNREYINVKGSRDLRKNKNLAGNSSRPVSWTLATFSTGDLGIICPLGALSQTQAPPMPTAYPEVPYYNTYKLTTNWFASHTISGVTYTWRQGNGW